MKRYIKRPDVYKPTLKHYLLILPIFIIMRLLMMTVRLKTSSFVRQKICDPKRFLGVAWHESIFFLAKGKLALRPNLDMAGLVSASRDAAYLVAFFNLIGIRSVRGSHARRGREAILDLVELLKSDSADTFITPDGPKGPPRIAKKGFLLVAEKADVRVLVIRFKCKRYFTIPSWDKMIIPFPFSSVEMELLEFASVDELKAEAQKAGKQPEEFASDYMNNKF